MDNDVSFDPMYRGLRIDSHAADRISYPPAIGRPVAVRRPVIMSGMDVMVMLAVCIHLPILG